MKDWRSLSLVFMAVALFLVGCGNVSSSDEKESTEIDNNVFLMFKYESTNDFDKNFGSLYYLTDGKEMEKVASDVSEGDFYYENDQDKVLFINKENELYQFFPGKEKEKLCRRCR